MSKYQDKTLLKNKKAFSGWNDSKVRAFDCQSAIFNEFFVCLFVVYRDTLNASIDRKRTQLSQLQRQLSELETNVHDLKSQKVKMNHKILLVANSIESNPHLNVAQI